MSDLNYKPSNWKAFTFLLVPLVFLGSSISLFYIHHSAILIHKSFSYWIGMMFLSFFFTQTFFLLHECGHLNFFNSKVLNKIIGNVFGILNMIPFYTWTHMHNLHHKWTGWRDLDPTTEKTVKPGGSWFEKMVVNIAWLLFIPIFYLSYMLSNYWNVFKIKRFVPKHVFRVAVLIVIFYFTIYFVLFFFFSTFMLYYILPAFILSLVWKELIIMTQHTHIEIPVSHGEKVRPISYAEQVKYTRSFYTNSFFARYFLMNFNLHEAHHLNPGLPAYWLDKVELGVPKSPKYFQWFKKAKSMRGEDYVFRTSKHTGKHF